MGIARVWRRADEILAIGLPPHVAQQMDEGARGRAVVARHTRSIRLVVLPRRNSGSSGEPFHDGARPRGPRSVFLFLGSDDFHELFGVMVLALLVDDVHDHVERRGMLRDRTPVGPHVTRRENQLTLRLY